MKTLHITLLSLLFIFSIHTFTSCEKEEVKPEEEKKETDTTDIAIYNAMLLNADIHEEESDYVWNSSDERMIYFQGSSIQTDAAGVSIDATYLTINEEGTYKCTGELTNGQIIVNADDAVVRIILSDVTITNANSACIYVIDAEKTLIVLDDSTSNYLSDGSSYTNTNDDGEPNATIFSKDNMTLSGAGYLSITGNYNDAINCKDGLIIAGGSYYIESTDEGIRGKDYLVINNGSFNITCDGDGLKSDNDDDASMGFIRIKDGTFEITSDGDGMYAVTDILVSDATMDITTDGGSSSSLGSSAKAFKAEVSVIIESGEYNLNCADNAIHSEGTIELNNGTFSIATGNDGINAATRLTFNGGTYDIYESHDGIESNTLVINDGNILVVSDDDGVNIGKADDTETVTKTSLTQINGGYLYINAFGHGLKTNDDIEMTDGTVIIHGPIASDNATIMYNGNFKVTGGFLIAAGSSGLAQAPGNSSTQNCVLVNFSSVQSAGDLFHIEASNGASLVTFEPSKGYQSLLFSSANLSTGASYSVYLGGTTVGENENGLYQKDDYTDGTQYTDFTISKTITVIDE